MSLFIELRREFHNHRNADDARVLLRRLKGRRDLYAAVEKEIDHALANGRQAEPAGAARAPAAPPSHSQPSDLRSHPNRVASEEPRADVTAGIAAPESPSNPGAKRAAAVRASEVQPAPESTSRRRGSNLKARVAASLVFAVIGGLLGLWQHYYWGWLYSPQRGVDNEAIFVVLPFVAFAVAGGLSGFDRRHVIFWLLGAAVGWVALFALSGILQSDRIVAVAFIFGASGGAVAGALLWYARTLIFPALRR